MGSQRNEVCFWRNVKFRTPISVYFRISPLIKSCIYYPIYLKGHPWGFPGSSDGKESACHAGDPASISRGSFQPRDWTCVFCLAGRFFTTEPLGNPIKSSNGTQIFTSKCQTISLLINSHSPYSAGRSWNWCLFSLKVEEMYKERMELKQHIKQGPA